MNSIQVLKRHFEQVPSTQDIMTLLLGQDTGDRDGSRDALASILSPVRDILDLLHLVKQMQGSVELHVKLLEESEELRGNLAAHAGLKDKIVSAKAELAELNPKLEVARADYEKVRDAMSKLRSDGGGAVVDAILGK